MNELIKKKCINGNLNKLKNIFENNIKKNDIEYYLKYLLVVACIYGHIDIVKYLIEYVETNNCKIDIHLMIEYAFRYACNSGNLLIIKYFIEYGEKYNNKIDIFMYDEECFIIAVGYTYTDLIIYLQYLKHHNYNILNNKYLYDNYIHMYNICNIMNSSDKHNKFIIYNNIFVDAFEYYININTNYCICSI